MKKWLQRIVIVLAVVFLGMQFYRPARTNPVTDPSKILRAPAHIQPILERSCYDCHSNESKWPWYTNVAPLSWSIIDHVNEGREELSFSEWGNYSPKKADHKLEEICEMVERRDMPLPEYLWLHRDAKLSDADRRTLCNWVVEERARIGGSDDRGRGRGRSGS
ncbi:MAG TPA: heme-binding domain-containing protein [Thermoanaerobaculia bacterium]|nr:heme-binding domain-containing protein [Thermoanaerobaculia bacterium]